MVALFHAIPRVLEPGFGASITPEMEIDCFCHATSPELDQMAPPLHRKWNYSTLNGNIPPEMELVALQALFLLQAPTFGSVFCKPKRDPCQ